MAARPLNGTTRLEEPHACTVQERQDFERLVREGFGGSDEGLPGRIRNAACLAFYRATGDELVAVAALKVPTEQYRDEVFEKARARGESASYTLELGWVYVVPAHRGSGIAMSLCGLLLARAPGSHVFATTRPTNAPMIRVLHALGFEQTGNSYQGRREELALYLQPFCT